MMGILDLEPQPSLFFLSLVNHPSGEATGYIFCSPNSSHEAQPCHPNILMLVLLFFTVILKCLFKALPCYTFPVCKGRAKFPHLSGN